MRRLLLLPLLLLAAAGCFVPRRTERAARATGEFRKHFELEQYEQIYAEADPEFKKTITAAQLSGLLRNIHARFGTTKDVDETGVFYNAGKGGMIVTLRYATKFERGNANEIFMWRVNERSTKLLNYHIDSPDVPAR